MMKPNKGSGWFEVYYFTPMSLFDHAAAACKGDAGANYAVRAFSDALTAVLKKTDEPTRCICLDCEIRFDGGELPSAFAILVPMFPFSAGKTTETAIASCVCRHCVRRADLEAAIMKTWRKMWPNISDWRFKGELH